VLMNINGRYGVTCTQTHSWLIRIDFIRMRCRQSRAYRAISGLANNKVRIYKSVVFS